MPDRNNRFDLLRFIGLLCIMLAHTEAPFVVQQGRSFDVPLMVLVSGAVYGINAKGNIPYGHYVVKRLARLMLPTWAFLSFFFVFIYAICSLSGLEYPFTELSIGASFLLAGDIGYLWIIKVFLLVALAAPLLFRMSNFHINDGGFILLLFVALGGVDLLYVLSSKSEILVNSYLFNQLVMYFLPYSCLFVLGIRLPSFGNKTVCTVGSLFFLCFLGFACYEAFCSENVFIGTMQYKYPPRLYYVSYAVAMSMLLYFLSGYAVISNLKCVIISFISRNSLWIYLWHILFLYVWQLFSPLWAEKFLLKFLLILCLSVSVVFFQVNFVVSVSRSFNLSYRVNKIIKIFFL